MASIQKSSIYSLDTDYELGRKIAYAGGGSFATLNLTHAEVFTDTIGSGTHYIDATIYEERAISISNIEKLKTSSFKHLLNSNILKHIEDYDISNSVIDTINIINDVFPNNIPHKAGIFIDTEEGSSWTTLKIFYGKNLSESEETFEIFLERFIDEIPLWAQSLICVIADPIE